MRPAIDVWRAACFAYGGLSVEGCEGEYHAAAVIEADRAALVAEIVKYLRQLDATREESNLIGWAANRVRGKFGGNNGDR